MNHKKNIDKLGISAHKFENRNVEVKPFTNRNKYIKPEERILCDNCELDRPEDEFHILIVCPLNTSHLETHCLNFV